MDALRENAIAQALADYRSGAFSSLRAAAAAYNIPQRTLSDRNNGATSRRESRADHMILSSNQERMLKDFLLQAECGGFPLTHAQIRDLVTIILRASGSNHNVGANWIPRFLYRHPELKTKRARAIASIKHQYVLASDIRAWHDRLFQVMADKDITPQNIYNMDETGSCLGICSNQTVAGSSKTNTTHTTAPQNRQWASVVECICVDGFCLTPLVIFKGKHVQKQWFNPMRTPDWKYVTTESAMITEPVAINWLQDIFIPETSRRQAYQEYRLLLLDGHKTHISLEFMWNCYLQQVQLFYLLPQATHILQPLDVGCFSPVKAKLRSQTARFADIDDAAPIAKQRFLQYYENARNDALQRPNIEAGFRATGIWPFDVEQPLKSPFIKHNDQVQATTVTTPVGRAPTSIDDVLATPQSRRQWTDLARTLLERSPSSRTLVRVIRKVGNSFDRMSFDRAVVIRRNKALERQLEDLKGKAKKRQAIDPNDTFVTVQDMFEIIEEDDPTILPDWAAIPVSMQLSRVSSLAARFRQQVHVVGEQIEPILIE